MKRLQYHCYGGPDVLRLDEVDSPTPRGHQVRVAVLAASLNPMDQVIRSGRAKLVTGSKFPRGVGHNFAGIVDAVGPDVTRFKVGDEVWGGTDIKPAGAIAEAVIADEVNTSPKPASVPYEVAGSLFIACVTAWTGLFDKAKLRAGQTVFITGCVGAVGRAAVQLARLSGAIVDGSCSAADRSGALSLGVREVFDYRTFNADALKGRYDVILDAGGSDQSLALSFAQCNSMLKRRGIAAHVVNTPASFLRSLISARHKTVVGKSKPERMVAIADAVVTGKLDIKIGRTVSLSEAIPAIVDFENGRSPKGKLFILPEQGGAPPQLNRFGS